MHSKKSSEVFHYYEMMLKQSILVQSYLEFLFCEKFTCLDFWSQFQKLNIAVMPNISTWQAEYNNMKTFNFFHFFFHFFPL